MEYYEEDVKSALNKAGNAYVNGMNKRAAFVADKVVKKPGQNASPSEYAKYKRDFQRWKARAKIGEFLVTGAIAVGPIDTAIKALTIIGLKNSRSPEDRLLKQKMRPVMNQVEKIKSKYTQLKERVHGKKITEAQVQREISLLDTMTSKATKEADHAKSGGKKSPAVATEECELGIIDVVYESDGNISMETFDHVRMLVEATDFSNGTEVMVLENYIQLLEESL